MQDCSEIPSFTMLPRNNNTRQSITSISSSASSVSQRPLFFDTQRALYQSKGGNNNFNKKSSKKESQSEKYNVDWIPSKAMEACQLCVKEFDLIHHRHHCRACGHVVCSSCSKERMKIPNRPSSRKKRVCTSCAEVLQMLYKQTDPSDENRSEEKLSQSSDAVQSLMKGFDEWQHNGIVFLIDREWYRQWKKTSRTTNSSSTIGPISNFALVDFINGHLVPKAEFSVLKPVSESNNEEDVVAKYIGVPPAVWQILAETYGGGPAIWVEGHDMDETDLWEIDISAPEELLSISTVPEEIDNQEGGSEFLVEEHHGAGEEIVQSNEDITDSEDDILSPLQNSALSTDIYSGKLVPELATTAAEAVHQDGQNWNSKSNSSSKEERTITCCGINLYKVQ